MKQNFCNYILLLKKFKGTFVSAFKVYLKEYWLNNHWKGKKKENPLFIGAFPCCKTVVFSFILCKVCCILEISVCFCLLNILFMQVRNYLLRRTTCHMKPKECIAFTTYVHQNCKGTWVVSCPALLCLFYCRYKSLVIVSTALLINSQPVLCLTQ